jgi:hypothetical protein
MYVTINRIHYHCFFSRYFVVQLKPLASSASFNKRAGFYDKIKLHVSTDALSANGLNYITKILPWIGSLKSWLKRQGSNLESFNYESNFLKIQPTFSSVVQSLNNNLNSASPPYCKMVTIKFKIRNSA